MKIDMIRIVTPAKIELTTPRPMLVSVPAALPSLAGSFFAWAWSSEMTP